MKFLVHTLFTLKKLDQNLMPWIENLFWALIKVVVCSCSMKGKKWWKLFWLVCTLFCYATRSINFSYELPWYEACKLPCFAVEIIGHFIRKNFWKLWSLKSPNLVTRLCQVKAFLQVELLFVLLWIPIGHNWWTPHHGSGDILSIHWS
jgi:hypothetical protein